MRVAQGAICVFVCRQIYLWATAITTKQVINFFSAFERCGAAAKANGKTHMSWVPNGAKAKEWSKYGMSMFFIGSEHSWMLRGANADAAGVHEI